MILLILNFVALLLSVHQLLFWLYFFQLKEYRIDRINASLATKDDILKVLFQQVDLSNWFRPKQTFKIIISGLIAFLIISFIFFLLKESYVVVILILITPLTTIVGLLAIFPFFEIVKQIVVHKALKRMECFKGKVIGITGSYGKTSTKEMLYKVLSTKYKVFKTEKNNNSLIGVAKTILKLPLNCDYFIVEMDAYQLGENAAICAIVHPQMGIVTGIGDQHAGLFKNLEDVKKAQYELIDSLPDDGYGIVADTGFKISDAKNITVFPDHVEFLYENQKFSVPIIGKSLVRNVIGVIKISLKLGVGIKEVVKALEDIDLGMTNPKIEKSRQGSVIIDSAYNASKESFINLLDYISVYKDFRKIIVTSGLYELGEQTANDYNEIAKQLGNIVKIILTTKNYSDSLNLHGNVEVETNIEKIKNYLKNYDDGKTVFVFINRSPRILIDCLK